MRIKLHEVELNTQDPARSREFYERTLGLKLNLAEPAGLNVFDSGWPGMDFNTSVHRPGKTVVSFLTDDLPACLAELRKKGVEIGDPKPSHLGMMVVELQDPDGHIVHVQGLTEQSPGWLREKFGF